MIRNIHPAEELFEIRARMRALKAREAELRAFFLAGPPAASLHGPAHSVTVIQQRRRVFQRSRLPPEILADPAMWKVKTSPVVRFAPRPEPTEPAAPGLSESPARFVHRAADDDLFEPFF